MHVSADRRSCNTLTSLLTFAVICAACRSTLSHDQRPFYNIAHMVNSIKEVNYYLSRGANAIEADVAFAPNGTALYTFHGYPCDCFRHCTELESLPKYLEYIREITRPGERRDDGCCCCRCRCCCTSCDDGIPTDSDGNCASRLPVN